MVFNGKHYCLPSRESQFESGWTLHKGIMMNEIEIFVERLKSYYVDYDYFTLEFLKIENHVIVRKFKNDGTKGQDVSYSYDDIRIINGV